jgi:hypothetical protein
MRTCCGVRTNVKYKGFLPVQICEIYAFTICSVLVIIDCEPTVL